MEKSRIIERKIREYLPKKINEKQRQYWYLSKMRTENLVICATIKFFDKVNMKYDINECLSYWNYLIWSEFSNHFKKKRPKIIYVENDYFDKVKQIAD